MPAGRPLKFQSVKELQQKIDAYFAERQAANKPISITGLALALDTTRETLCDYGERDEFSDTIKRAKLRVENFYEERLTLANATGPIFALKNFDWSDKQQTELSGEVRIGSIERHIVDPKHPEDSDAKGLPPAS